MAAQKRLSAWRGASVLFCRPLSARCLRCLSLCPPTNPPTSNTLRTPALVPQVIEKQGVRETEAPPRASLCIFHLPSVPAQGPRHH